MTDEVVDKATELLGDLVDGPDQSELHDQRAGLNRTFQPGSTSQ
jgi:hypothetical protein